MSREVWLLAADSGDDLSRLERQTKCPREPAAGCVPVTAGLLL